MEQKTGSLKRSIKLTNQDWWLKEKRHKSPPLLLFFSHSVVSNSLWPPMDCSRPVFPVLHQLPKFVETHVHWVGDAIHLSRPLLSPFPLAFNLSQHQGLFQWVFTSSGQSIRASASASVLPVNIQDWFSLGWTGWISLQSKELSRVFTNTTVQKHHSLVLSFLYNPTLTSIHDL